MTLTRVLVTLTNAEDGLEAQVMEIGGGYSVVLRDVDAGEFLYSGRFFPTEAAATEYAEFLLGGVGGGGSVLLN